MRIITLVDPEHGPLTPLETPGPIYFTCVPDEKTWELLPGTKLYFDMEPDDYVGLYVQWEVLVRVFDGDTVASVDSRKFEFHLDARQCFEETLEVYANVYCYDVTLFGYDKDGVGHELDEA